MTDQPPENPRDHLTPQARYERATNKVGKWRSVLAGRILGTRPDGDPATQGIRDLLDKNLILRIEVTILTRLLLEKGVITQEEFWTAGVEEADYINGLYEREWPGITSTDYGISISLPEGAETLKRKSQP